ncbi:MAG: chemotaxis protein CheV [Oligoflexia bacterium]|nr:chemotaxis protein CheV [Oligoflexia bacterium]
MNAAQKNGGILLESGTNEVEFLLITLGSQRYGINVSKICNIQVFDPTKLAPLPLKNPEELGLLEFRNKTISVIDLSVALQWKPLADQSLRRLLVVAEFNQRTTGFVVDAVDRIERFSWSNFEPISETTLDAGETSVLGTVHTSNGLVLILDLETILAKLDPSMSVQHYASSIGQPTLSRDKVKILHCDDSPLIQKVVAKTLQDAGFSALTQCSNGEMALNYLKEHGPQCVDIVLSDIEMPRMDGLSLCRAVREELAWKNLPVVFFSSLITDQMRSKCENVGGNGAFSKPQINMLVQELERLLRSTGS